MTSPFLRSVRSFPALVGLSLGLVVLADRLFYEQELGWTLGLYVATLGICILLRTPLVLRSSQGRAIVAAWAATVASLVLQTGVLGSILAVVALISLRLAATTHWYTHAARWVGHVALFAAIGWTRIIGDGRVIVTACAKRRSGKWPGTGVFRKWAVPMGLSIGFLLLFRAANPLIARWISDFWEAVSDSIRFPESTRILFWCVSLAVVWTVLRYRPHKPGKFWLGAGPPTSGSSMPRQPPLVPGDLPFDVTGAAFIERCLFLFNALFLFQNLLDVRYLWAGAELPAGMTYAQYAHRGAYPLVATALLAAGFVLATFRAGAPADGMRRARRLVYVWLAQNMFLTFSAAFRLGLYVEVYTLTRLRVAAAIWMLLVVLGLVFILWRILRNNTNDWLVNANVLALLTVLLTCSFVDFDGRIAWYNARHAHEVAGAGPNLDVSYLHRLGPDALPALVWFRDTVQDPGAADRADAAILDLRYELTRTMADWRGWTWERARIAHARE